MSPSADVRLEIPNLALREHVTRVGFDLTLGKTHVVALVTIDTELKYGKNADSRKLGKLWQWDAVAHRALRARGLIEARYGVAYERRHKHWSTWAGAYVWDSSWPGDVHPRERYAITIAGRAVITLLEQAGLYDEIAGQVIEVLEPVTPTVKVRHPRHDENPHRPPPDWPGTGNYP